MLLYLSSGHRSYATGQFGQHVTPARRVWEIEAVVKGACGPILPDRKPELLRRRLWVFHPQCPHGWMDTPGTGCDVVVFHYSHVPEPLDMAVPNHGLLSVGMDASITRRLVNMERQLRPYAGKSDAISALTSQKALLDISMIVLKNAGPVPQIAPRVFARDKVNTVLAWYSEHMIEMPSLERVSEVAGISSRQLRRYFMMVRKQSPARAFRQMRMQRAEELLASSEMTGDKVAGFCGFGSDSDFSRAFKAYHGENPSQWRRRNRRPHLPGN